jgi:hypothetical protein
MQIIIHTKHGKFKGKKYVFDEDKYTEISSFLNRINRLEYVSFETETGEIFLTKVMIDDSVFEIIK